MLLGASAWVGLVPGEWLALFEVRARGHLPYWADSVGLPALSWAFAVLGTLPVAAGLAWFVALRRARLPVPLWLWNRERPVRSLLWTAVCGVLLLPFAALLARAVDQGRFLMVPLAAVLIYLVLSARAAVLWGACVQPRAETPVAGRAR